VTNQRGRYLDHWQSDMQFWLIALRQTGLTDAVKEEIGRTDWACVLWKRHVPALALAQTDIENQIEIWKPIEVLLERAMAGFA